MDIILYYPLKPDFPALFSHHGDRLEARVRDPNRDFITRQLKERVMNLDPQPKEAPESHGTPKPDEFEDEYIVCSTRKHKMKLHENDDYLAYPAFCRSKCLTVFLGLVPAVSLWFE